MTLSLAIETITPERAQLYLEHNGRNRPIRPSRVHELASSMLRGEWHLTHQGMAFDEDGVLLDGQHRLLAVIEAGVPVQMLVARQADAASFSVLDIGSRRMASDMLAIYGEKNSGILSQALGWLFRREQHLLLTRARPTPLQLLDVLARHPAIRDSIRVVSEMEPRSLLVPGMATWLHYEFSLKDPEEADIFFYNVGKGEDLSADTPEFIVRQRILNLALSHNGRTIRQYMSHVIAAYLVKAWNARVTGETLRVLRFRTDETFPEIKGLGKKRRDVA